MPTLMPCSLDSFVDRDMVMRYHFGLGVGHVYSHGSHPLSKNNVMEQRLDVPELNAVPILRSTPLASTSSLPSATTHTEGLHSSTNASSLPTIPEHSVGGVTGQVSHSHHGSLPNSETLQPTSEPLANMRMEDAEDDSDDDSNYSMGSDDSSLSDSSRSRLSGESSDMDEENDDDDDDVLDITQEEEWAEEMYYDD